MKILIDGENFRHQIAHVLQANGKIADSHQYFAFDWAGFLAEVCGSTGNDTTYYTTKIRLPDHPPESKMDRRITEISEANRRQIADLNTQGIRVVKAGLLRLHESNDCVHCGQKTLILQEKGVDVRVAIDLLLASMAGAKDIVLVSSDSDLVPALNAVGPQEGNITYLCYTDWINRAVAAGVNNTITFDDAAVLKYYKGKQA